MEFTTTNMLRTLLNTRTNAKVPTRFGWVSTDDEMIFVDTYGLMAKDFLDVILTPVEDEEPWGIVIDHPVNGNINLTGWFHNLDDRSAGSWWAGMFDTIIYNGGHTKLKEDYEESLNDGDTYTYITEMIEGIFTKALMAVVEHSTWVESDYFNIDPLMDKLKEEYNPLYFITYANADGEEDALITRDVYEILAHYGFTESGMGIDELRGLAREDLVELGSFERYCEKFGVETEGKEYEWSIKLGVLMAWLQEN